MPHPPVPHDGELQRGRVAAPELTGAFPFPNELAHQVALQVDDIDPYRPSVEDVEVAGTVETDAGNAAEGVPATPIQRAQPVDFLEAGVERPVFGRQFDHLLSGDRPRRFVSCGVS